MIKYLAFLRGINVSGSKIIRMAELQNALQKNGFPDAKTYIQSGNIFFTSAEKRVKKLEEKIHAIIQKQFQHDVPVVVLPRSELEKLIQSKPFGKKKTTEKEYLCVSFVRDITLFEHLPRFTPKKDVEIISREKNTVFSISHRVNGKTGNPNLFLETKLKTIATTRKWEMLQTMLEKNP